MGSFYKITQEDENAVYERGETDYVRINIQNPYSTYALTDPSTVSISINDPCGNTLLADTAMTKLSTGVYTYHYPIGASASYGEYEITFTTSTPTYVQKDKERFILLPWDVVQDIRTMTGIADAKTISNHDIAKVILEAYNDALNTVYVLHKSEWPDCNPDDGSWFNGTNTTFATKHSPIADSNGDGEITGWGEKSCGTDVVAWWKDADGNCKRAKVTVNESHCGNITITQLDGTAIPSSCGWVKLDYHTEYSSYDEALFKQAVVYLAADKCMRRFQELRRATLADLDSSKTVVLATPNRFKTEYLKLIKKISEPRVGQDRKNNYWKRF